jgi:hypothetical protein
MAFLFILFVRVYEGPKKSADLAFVVENNSGATTKSVLIGRFATNMFVKAYRQLITVTFVCIGQTK